MLLPHFQPEQISCFQCASHKVVLSDEDNCSVGQLRTCLWWLLSALYSGRGVTGWVTPWFLWLPVTLDLGWRSYSRV